MVSPDFVNSQIRAAIARALDLDPDAPFDVAGITLPVKFDPGLVLDAYFRLLTTAASAAVGSATVDSGPNVDGKWIQVEVRVAVLGSAPDPRSLFYSDDPELLQTDGVLFQSTTTVDKTHPVGVYAYHASGAAPQRRVSLVMRTAAARTRVRLIGASAGPLGEDHVYVSHRANVAYLRARALQQSSIVTLDPNIPSSCRSARIS